MKRVLPLLISLFVSAFPTVAQTTSTTILGTITDSSGALVAGAKVTSFNVNTGIRREVTSSATGDYGFP